MKLLITLIFIFVFRDFIFNFFIFLKWKVVDVVRFVKKGRKKKLHLYGIWLYCGLYGQGKTMALSEYLTRMRKRYKDKIYICTNYGFKEEDFSLENWKTLLREYDKPIIFGYDEIQNEFNSRDYKNFPYELVKLLTQNRKGNGKQIVGTAQRFCRVDKVIRELCSHVIECKTLLGRWTFTKKYDIEDYEQYLVQTDPMKKRKILKHKYSFVQTDKLRDCYDSFQMLQSAKTKEYMSIYEKNGVFTADELLKMKKESEENA